MQVHRRDARRLRSRLWSARPLNRLTDWRCPCASSLAGCGRLCLLCRYVATSLRCYAGCGQLRLLCRYVAMSLCRYAASRHECTHHRPLHSHLARLFTLRARCPLSLLVPRVRRRPQRQNTTYATSPRSSPASRSGRAWPRSELVIDSGSKRTCVVACLSAGALVLVKCSYLRCTCGPPVGCCHPLLAALVLTAGRMLAFLCNS